MLLIYLQTQNKNKHTACSILYANMVILPIYGIAIPRKHNPAETQSSVWLGYALRLRLARLALGLGLGLGFCVCVMNIIKRLIHMRSTL